MSMNSSFSFPLLASDQADVIRIFIDLMSERDRAERRSEVKANQPAGSHDDSGNLWSPGRAA